MTTKTEALKLALEALEDIKGDCSGCEFEWSNDYPLQAKAHAAIKEALAQPEQEPVAWRAWFDADNSAKWLFTLWPEEEHPSFDWQPLYTTPPQRTWVGLTDEQINKLRQQYGITSDGRGIKEWVYVVDFARAIEAAHGIKE